MFRLLAFVVMACSCCACRRQVLEIKTENEVKFNKSYQALYRQLKDVYTKIGATDFFGVVGEKFIYSRHEKVGAFTREAWDVDASCCGGRVAYLPLLGSCVRSFYHKCITRRRR